jgi:hypothetical protein
MKSRLNFILTLLVVLLLFTTGLGFCQSTLKADTPLGTIKGKVADMENKSPMPGVSIELVGNGQGVVSGADGIFVIEDLSVGSYVLRLGHTGYETLAVSDIIVRSGRITSVSVELKPLVFEIEGVVVDAGYFSQTREQPTSSVNFSAEEIRRAPGSAGDVSRIVSLLPSIAKVNDESNALIVRGGNPFENAFYIDNMEIPNINHYPTLGSSGGPIGLLNVDFIQDVNFSSGGFSAAYGDRLSSVMELTYREGNRDQFLGQVDMNMTGLGFTGEGPVTGGRGSWMFSARRSYLDLIVDAIGTGVAPRYSDYQGKLTYDLGPSDKLSVLGIMGLDFIELEKQDALDEGNNAYGKSDLTENLIGVNWQHLWGTAGYSNTSISHMYNNSKNNFYSTDTDRELTNYNTVEQAIQFRNENSLRTSRTVRLKFGLDAKYLSNDYDNFLAHFTDPMGNYTPENIVDQQISAQKAGVFASYIWQPTGRLEATLGARWDYFSFTGNSYLSPRLALSYRLTEKTSLNGAAGIYHQNLPMIILSKYEDNKDLADPVARQLVVGIDHLLSENTKLTIEVYDKEYDHFPLDPTQPQLFIMDELFYDLGFFASHENLVDAGRANTRGVELVLQKKLARDFYGMVSGSYFRSRYRDFDGTWRDRVFDNRYIFSAEGGYKPNNKWEFSARWVIAGGAPHTPFDLQASTAANQGIFDSDRINEERKPSYQSLNVRFDRRFNFSGSNIILFLDIWNVYGRKNVASYYWNEAENKQDVITQWSFLPIMGLEWEF